MAYTPTTARLLREMRKRYEAGEGPHPLASWARNWGESLGRGGVHIHGDLMTMHLPVMCSHCGGIYDLSTVEVTARYSDCSTWKTPCCQWTADDREWKSLPDYQRIDT